MLSLSKHRFRRRFKGLRQAQAERTDMGASLCFVIDPKFFPLIAILFESIRV